MRKKAKSTPDFTPGRWKLQRYAGHNAEKDWPGKIVSEHGVEIYAGPFSFRALRGRTDEEAEANARLIAAAPSLFAACQDALKLLDNRGGNFVRVRHALVRALVAADPVVIPAPKPKAKPVRLGSVQRHMLSAMVRHKRWFRGCGWYWSSRGGTQKLCESLARRGLFEEYALSVGNRTLQAWRPTPAGIALYAELFGSKSPRR